MQADILTKVCVESTINEFVYLLFIKRLKMEEEYRKKSRNPREKKNVSRVTDEDKDRKRMSREFKRTKKDSFEEEDDWQYWQEYYK